MPGILVKDLPFQLHQKLKLEAQRHHRSMNRQVIVILEKELGQTAPPALPPPIKLKKPVDPKWIVDIIRQGRENNP